MNNKLTPQQIKIIKDKETEAPFSGKYVDHKEDGTYTCAQCNTPLFSSTTKFDSGSGWPSFYDVVEQGNVDLEKDNSGGMERVEVVCKTCKGHLGHLFDDGPSDKGGKRYSKNWT